LCVLTKKTYYVRKQTETSAICNLPLAILLAVLTNLDHCQRQIRLCTYIKKSGHTMERL